MLDRCVLNNRAQTTAIVKAAYAAFKFDPGRDRHLRDKARTVNGVLAFLLKNDAGLAEMKIGELLDCPPKQAAAHVSLGEQLIRNERDARANVETIRSQVRKELGLPAPVTERAAVAVPDTDAMQALVTPLPLIVTRDTPVKDVARVIGKILDIPYPRIMSASRCAPESDARHIAMAISQMMRCERSKKYIAGQFNRDHTCVISGLKKINRCIADPTRYPELHRKIGQVCEALSLVPSQLITRFKTDA